LLPDSNTFTIVLDTQARRAIAGGVGSASVVPVTTTDGRTFKTVGKIVTGFPSAGPCVSVLSVTYDSLQLTISGDALEGSGTGSVQISCGDCVETFQFNAALTGSADHKAPFLTPAPGTGNATPFDPFGVFSSEPLVATSKARLVAGDGSTVDLVPTVSAGDPPFVMGFNKPSVVLRPGEGYSIAVDGLVDFAGNSGATEAPLRLAAFAPAPLVSPDGFESVTDATIGGAPVVKAGGSIAPISGAKSVYVGGAGAPPLDNLQPGRALDVRLAVPAGVTKVKFAYRLVALGASAFFDAAVRVGSVGHGPGALASAPLMGQAAPTTTDPGAATLYATPVATAEFALPADLGDELLLSIDIPESSCDGGPRPSPPNAGILVDDLALE
jgi:hypothetical protein